MPWRYVLYVQIIDSLCMATETNIMVVDYKLASVATEQSQTSTDYQLSPKLAGMADQFEENPEFWQVTPPHPT